ncbi:MAG: DUF938 domain-containing protein [Rhizobiaceae bacterium]|nr:DUF938 domain-containing protein [Rhizobiaceae bacterium]
MTNRLNASSYHRNIDAIGSVVTGVLEGKSGHLLEIGSGTGQHITALAAQLPDITFWPSDPDQESRDSTDAWAQHLQLENVKPASLIDGSSQDWGLGKDGSPPTGLTAIQCFNVIHISPWPVALGLLKSASQHLRTGGHLILYGPYKVDGEHIGQGNIDFDLSLRNRNSEWGIREIEAVESEAKKLGLSLQAFEKMPANNFMPVFIKT